MTSLDTTYGAYFIGDIVAAVLYGCICVQTWYYYTHYPFDRWYIKLLVAAVAISETCHQVLITHATYTYLVTHFGDFKELTMLLWSPIVSILFIEFTTVAVQCFLAMRIYRLSKQSWLAAGSVIIVVIIQLIIVLVFFVKIIGFRDIAQVASLSTLMMAMNAVSASGDLFIALFLCFLLQRSRTGFRKSDTLINRLIMFCLNTGLLTSLCAIAVLVSVSAWPHTFIYMAFYCNVGRLYCNALLVTLNARKGLASDAHGDISFCHNTSRFASSSTASSEEPEGVPHVISIKVDATRECVQDEYPLSGDKKDTEVV